MKIRILIDPMEYQEYVLKFIGSEDFNRIWDNMSFKDKSECKNAFITGMAWAAMLTSQVNDYEVVVDNEDKVSE